jgi:hypothetical protein
MKACKWGEKALSCDECDTWYHASCTGINTQEYSRFANSSVSWYCMICDAPNHSTVLYDLIDSAESNTYSLISNSDALSKASPYSDALSKASTVTLDTDDSDSCIGDPLATSPKRTTKEPHNKQINKKDLKNLNNQLPEH